MLKQPIREKFLEAMVKEVFSQEWRKHWRVQLIASVPKGGQILDSICAMRRKRCIGTGEVHKYKARLNAHVEQKIHRWSTGTHLPW